jgi:uncharacterized membrane protein YfcA
MLIGYFIFSYLPLQQMANDSYKWYKTLDKAFPIMVLAGFLAQMVDGALGMGYGVTSATILLSAGVNPLLLAEAFIRQKCLQVVHRAIATTGLAT